MAIDDPLTEMAEAKATVQGRGGPIGGVDGAFDAIGEAQTARTHSARVREILAEGKTASYDHRCLAIVEVDDCSLPHLVLEILGRDGQFERLFERELMTAEGLKAAHLPVIVRLAMYGQPVGEERA